MELLYFYIEDDGKNIMDCEFNFSPHFRFHYQKESKYLECEEIESYGIDFWEAENISNITAIIGKNGSGKSNLIEFILRFCVSSSGVREYNQGIIFIYKKDTHLFINREDIKSNYTFQIKSYVQYPFNRHNQDTLTKIVYFSPHTEKFVLNGLGRGLMIDDISNSGILRSDSFRRGDRKYAFTDLEYLHMIDSLRHMWLFKFLVQHPNDFGIPIPQMLNLKLHESDSKNKEFSDPNYQKLFNDIDKEQLRFEEHIQNRLLNIIFSRGEIPSIGIVNNFEEFIDKHYSGKFYNSIINLNKQGKIHFKKGPYPLGPYNSYFEFSIKTKDLNDDFIKGLYYFYFRKEVFFGISTLSHHFIMNDNISWEWCGTASGELSFYNLFSRLLESAEIIKSLIYDKQELKSIILLLDEPETSFHPEWQRKFLKELIEFTKTAFKAYKVQIIIASHSPILVSDFPTNNIIFLDRDEKTGKCKVVNSINQENTFGANIHSLYKNSFFLDGLPIGEFAKRKINKIIKELEEGKATKELYSQIHLIGEPLIRDQLMKLYNQNHPYNIEERISLLEHELAELKKRNNNDKN